MKENNEYKDYKKNNKFEDLSKKINYENIEIRKEKKIGDKSINWQTILIILLFISLIAIIIFAILTK